MTKQSSSSGIEQTSVHPSAVVQRPGSESGYWCNGNLIREDGWFGKRSLWMLRSFCTPRTLLYLEQCHSTSCAHQHQPCGMQLPWGVSRGCPHVRIEHWPQQRGYTHGETHTQDVRLHAQMLPQTHFKVIILPPCPPLFFSLIKAQA